MSFSETIFLFLLALIIFGPKKLPGIARQVGRVLNDFKRASNEFKAQIEQEIAHLEEEPNKILPPSTPPEGITSRTATIEAVDSDQASLQATLAAPPAAPAPGSNSNGAESQPVATEAAPSAETLTTSQESHA
jgi:TatA/E family protein of Tat protein translocase